MREIHYDENRVPAYTLPEVLRQGDGSVVGDADAWRRRRREILGLFAAEVYGHTPEIAVQSSVEVLEEDTGAWGGRAWRRQLRLHLAHERGAVALDLLLYLPGSAGPARPVPVFLGLNFAGNHTVAADPAIHLPRTWVPATKWNATHRAVEEDRGLAAASWSAERLLARGYGLATVYYGDIEPDHPGGWADGVRGLLGPGGPPTGEHAWGALAAWAWGLSRVRDYLGEAPGVSGIALMGHSRLGKAAVWAGAQDERFALVVSNNSGCGGAALFRREYGETVARINEKFPHWFCPAFHRYDDREAELPVDQHMLLALIAPRPLYVASGEEDRWSDPRGEFLSALAADPVYRLLGADGLGVAEMPAVGRPVGGDLAYHIRPGGHGVLPYDWERYLDFADGHLGRGGGA